MKFFSVLIFFIFVNVIAQSSDTIVEKLQEKFITINDFSSSFTQTTSGSFVDSDLNLTGKLYYKKKNKFRVDLKNMELISDGITIWNYDKRLNRVVINNIDENQAFLNLDDLINKYPELCNSQLVKTNNPILFGVKLIPMSGNLEFTSAELWIDKNYLLKKIILNDSSGSEFTVELSEIILNKNITDDRFVFTAPEGCKVIDFR